MVQLVKTAAAQLYPCVQDPINILIDNTSVFQQTAVKCASRVGFRQAAFQKTVIFMINGESVFSWLSAGEGLFCIQGKT